MSLIRLACSVLLATMVASTAWAEAVTEADWAEKPTPERVGGAYPKMAQMLAIEGTAILSCKVTAGGILENCAASAEAPREFGFAAAALSLTPYFRMRPEIRDGRAALSEVRIPLHFILPEPQPLAQTGRPTSAQAQALARDFVRLDHRADQLRELYRAKSQLLEFIRTPGAPPDVRQAAGAATRAALEGRMEEILDAMASVYAAKFTERELKDIVRATREKDPPVFLVQRADLTEVEKNLMSEFNRRLQVSARAAFCERQACTPDRDFGLPRAGQGGPEVNIPVREADRGTDRNGATAAGQCVWNRRQGAVGLHCWPSRDRRYMRYHRGIAKRPWLRRGRPVVAGIFSAQSCGDAAWRRRRG